MTLFSGESGGVERLDDEPISLNISLLPVYGSHLAESGVARTVRSEIQHPHSINHVTLYASISTQPMLTSIAENQCCVEQAGRRVTGNDEIPGTCL